MSTSTEDVAVVPNKESRALQLQEQQLLPTLSPTLSCWTATFTDCILSSSRVGCGHGPCDENGNGNGDGAFVLLDTVMESDTANTSKNDKASGFCDHLTSELDVFLNKLTPARTKGDHKADEILKLLQSMGSQFPNPQHTSQQQQQQQQQHQKQQSTSEATTTADKVRGDNSIFISREYRQQKLFVKKHPYLHELISRVSNTFDLAFGGSKDGNSNSGYPRSADTGAKDQFQLDFSMTSVQLAVYPGDSRSGYRRHCDREHSCQQEETETGTKIPGAARKNSTPNNNNTKPERLITCIYYLTDDDWDASRDGGALRLFCSGGDAEADAHIANSCAEVRKNQISSLYTDVLPFRDRMVVFRSDRIEHQVMPSHRRPRLAITIWFYGIVSNTHSGIDSSIPVSAHSGSNTAGKTRPIPTASNGSCLVPPLPIRRISHTNGNSPSVFVSLASYRDSETRPTIDAMYSTALKPHRIFTGIVAQLVEGEKDDEAIWTSITSANEFRSTSKPWTPGSQQLRAMRLHARDATGPCYARGLCQSLYRGEDYVLQIDSHMRFRQNWDEYLIQTINSLRDRRRKMSAGDEIGHCDKIMLTTYPVGYTRPNNIPKETRGTYLVPWKFDDQGMLRQRGRLVRRRSAGPTSNTERDYHGDGLDSSRRKIGTEVAHPSSATHSYRQYLYAGGFNFGPSRVLFDVPYDTMGLHHLFFGEELSMAVRLFTHGYDLYSPEETVCYHLWSRSHRPTAPAATAAATTVERENRLRELSRAKVEKQLLGHEVLVGSHFGLGKARTAASFAEHLGVDFENRAFVREGWDSGELKSEDFVENRDGNQSLFPADSVEAKVASLDSRAQSLIVMFLQGLQN